VKTPPPDLARRLVASGDTILGGGADIRLEEVAATVGVARTTLYYYFSGRDDLVSFLLAEHLKHGADLIREATERPEPPAIQLRRVTVALVQFLGQHPALCTGLLASLGAVGRMDEVLAANEAFIVTPVRQLVEAGMAAGELRTGDPGDVASTILGGILLVVLSRTLQCREVTSDDAADQIANQILRGPLT
jgi:AcrR family transcriptional regulator